MKKVFLFGLLGALGSLAGWAVGEPLLRPLIPWARAHGTGAAILTPPEPPTPAPVPPGSGGDVPTPDPPSPPEPFRVAPPPPPPTADFATRLERAGAGHGQVQIALSWANTNDLDLHVIEPTGNKIWAHGKRSPSGGELDVDSNFTGPSVVLTNEPVEHVNYREGAPEGHYWVYVSHFFKRGPDPTPYKVGLFLNGQWSYYRGEISFLGREGEKPRNDAELATQLVCEFDVKSPGPELRLSVPGGVAVAPGRTNRFQVKIARHLFEGAVQIGLTGASQGVTIDAAPIPAGAASGYVTIRAAEGAPLGPQALRLTASADGPHGRVQATEPMKIQLLEPPRPAPVLKLSAPEQVEVYPGGRNTFKVKIGRYFFPAETPVKVQLDTGATDSLSTPSLTVSEAHLGAGETETTLEVAATAAALTGVQRTRLVAKAATAVGLARTETRLDVLVVPAPPPPPVWPMTFVVSLWTSLLAAGLTMALIAAQNRALHRPLFSSRQALALLPGSVVAGAIAGASGQLLFHWLGRQMDFAPPPALGQVIGWLFLGALLGAGLALYIPNLPRPRAALAGTVGGLVGAIAFLGVTAAFGPGLGRFAGALILGFAIGSMVVLVQVIIREAWLELQYENGERAEVSLGGMPITIGSDARACTIYVPGTAPLACRYELTPAGVVLTDIPTDRRQKVPLGATRRIGPIGITVRGLAHQPQPGYSEPPAAFRRTTIILPRNPEPPTRVAQYDDDEPTTPPFDPTAQQTPPEELWTPPTDEDIHVIDELDDGDPRPEVALEPEPPEDGATTFILRLSDGRELALEDGLELRPGSLAGLQPLDGELIAKVARSKVKPDEIGFRNLSGETWKASGGGETIEVQPGQNVRLSNGCHFDFGPLKGQVVEKR